MLPSQLFIERHRSLSRFECVDVRCCKAASSDTSVDGGIRYYGTHVKAWSELELRVRLAHHEVSVQPKSMSVSENEASRGAASN
jgi:hypothetical protein